MVILDFIKCNGETYEVNSVSMTGFDQFLNPAMALRNEMFGIQAVGETMIWAVTADKTRRDPILHCQRYLKVESIQSNHAKIVDKLKRGNDNFFNGDGYPK